MNISYFELFFTSVVLFLFALAGIFVIRRHIIAVLIALELMLLSLNLSFLAGSLAHDELVGQIVILCTLTVAAGEAAIGLAILVVYYRLRGVISVDFVSLLKG
jgi:NADH-quinone oxidoreductase subunit K